MRKIVMTLLLCATVFGVTACGNKKTDEVNIAYFDNITHGQALVMKAQNSLQDALGDDVKVKWTAFNAGPAEVEACFSGDIDIGYIGPVPAATAYVKSHGDFVIISSATNGGAVLIAKSSSGIKSVKELSGKTVAVPQLGNTQHLLLLDLLKDNNMAPESEGGDVKVVEASNADVANLIDSGDIDAALVPEPWGTTIMETVDAQIVLDYDELNNKEPYSTAVVIVNKEFMKTNEDIVKKFLKTHIDATNYIVEYPEEACKVMNEQLDKDTGKSLDANIITEAVKKIDYSYEIAEKSVMDYCKISIEQKFISEQPKEDIFDNRLFNELTK